MDDFGLKGSFLDLQKKYLFCYFSRLDKFFTLKKTNSFAFSSLNQNFALSLHA